VKTLADRSIKLKKSYADHVEYFKSEVQSNPNDYNMKMLKISEEKLKFITDIQNLILDSYFIESSNMSKVILDLNN
jgi:ribose 5-phosphate isomerase